MENTNIDITRSTIKSLIEKLIFEMGVEADQIKGDVSLMDLGLDSLDVVELSLGIKKSFIIQISPGDFADAETIDQAIDVVALKVGLA
jgi:acyl carrier protein